MPVELSIDGFGDRTFAGSVERINPMTEAGTRAILVFVQIPNPDAALRGRHVRHRPHPPRRGRAVPTLPLAAIRTEAGQTYVWSGRGRSLARRSVALGRRDEAAALVELKSALPADAQVLAARFDNLKEGGPAVLRAPSATKPAG